MLLLFVIKRGATQVGIESDPDALENLVDQCRGNTHAKKEKRIAADRVMGDPLGVDV